MSVKALILLFLVSAASSVFAELKMPAVFSDNMVMQRGIPVPVWGWTGPGQKVTVIFKTQEKSVVAGTDGKWMIRLEPLTASAQPEKLAVQEKNGRKEFNNVVVGDVWICSGQSNMAFRMVDLAKPDEEIRQAGYPQIRILSIADNSTPLPRRFFESAGWQTCSSQSVYYFSAAGYFFGRKLFQELNIPVGLIDSSWGGTRIESWTPPEGIAVPGEQEKVSHEFKNMTIDDKKKIVNDICQSGRNKDGAERCRKAKDEWAWSDEKVFDYVLSHDYYPQKMTCIYNGKIYPLIPYGIKGIIWYQGESHFGEVDYSEKQQALVNSWRQLWQEGDFPFYIVQLTPYRPAKDALPPLWLQQYDAVRKLKNSGIVSTGDIGDLNNVHPKNKYDLGLRLALLALRDTYGRKDVVASGPTYKSMEIAGDKIIVHFENTGSGLMTKDGQAPTWFEIAGSEQVFNSAQAVIKGQSVEISNPNIKSPEYVRFAWSGIAEPNLRNKEGLPAFPFNTALPFFQPEQPVVAGTLRLIKQSGQLVVGMPLKSQTAIPLQGIIRLKSSAFASGGSANYAIAPEEEKTIFLPVTLKKDAPPALEVTVMVSAQGKILSFSRHLQNAPILELKEKAWSEQFKIEKLNDGDKPVSPADLSATIVLSREKNAILIKVKVKDDKRGDFTRSDSPWEEDCIELFLDMNPCQTRDFNYPEKYNDTTYQIAVSPNRNKDNRIYCNKSMSGLTVEQDIRQAPDGYEADIRIEFSEPIHGKCIGLELAVDDSDSGKRKTQLVWNCAGKNYCDRSGWKIISCE